MELKSIKSIFPSEYMVVNPIIDEAVDDEITNVENLVSFFGLEPFDAYGQRNPLLVGRFLPESYESVFDIFNQAFNSKENYHEFLDGYRSYIRKAEILSRVLKKVRKSGYDEHLISSQAANLRNSTTRLIWIRMAGKAWRRAVNEAKKMKEAA